MVAGMFSTNLNNLFLGQSNCYICGRVFFLRQFQNPWYTKLNDHSYDCILEANQLLQLWRAEQINHQHFNTGFTSATTRFSRVQKYSIARKWCPRCRSVRYARIFVHMSFHSSMFFQKTWCNCQNFWSRVYSLGSIKNNLTEYFFVLFCIPSSMIYR